MKKEAVKHVKKGDTVKVLAGKDNGKTGKVLSVITRSKRVLDQTLSRLARSFARHYVTGTQAPAPR